MTAQSSLPSPTQHRLPGKRRHCEVDSKEAAVQLANETIVDLLRAVMGVSDLVESIATALQEQRAGINQIKTRCL
jgi:methyl-accepting chemotaxis protein